MVNKKSLNDYSLSTCHLPASHQMATSHISGSRFDDGNSELTGDVSGILDKFLIEINQAGPCWTIQKQSLRRSLKLSRNIDRIKRCRKRLHM